MLDTGETAGYEPVLCPQRSLQWDTCRNSKKMGVGQCGRGVRSGRSVSQFFPETVSLDLGRSHFTISFQTEAGVTESFVGLT